MWSKLDDTLLDHRKIFSAGEFLGQNGPGLALGMYAVGLMWTNKHLTDGHLPMHVVKHWPHFTRPLKLAEALVTAGLWERVNGGFAIHDFHQHNFTAKSVREHRARISKMRSKAGHEGGVRSAKVRRNENSLKQKGSKTAATVKQTLEANGKQKGSKPHN